MACTIHANSAADALEALVNAALMAGENIPERVVRKVFSNSIDLVVHLDRDSSPSSGGVRRETMEILAVVPALRDDFSTEALFSRPQLGEPLEWTGSLPHQAVADRLSRATPAGLKLSDVMRDGIAEW